MAKWLYKNPGINCQTCGKCICAPRMCKNPPHPFVIKMDCEVCENGKFSAERFSIHHLGSNKWKIMNDEGQTWMGKDQWVAESSSHHALMGSEIEIFTWNELIDFVERNFACDLVG